MVPPNYPTYPTMLGRAGSATPANPTSVSITVEAGAMQFDGGMSPSDVGPAFVDYLKQKANAIGGSGSSLADALEHLR
jgi:hypothetical protein